ncbi:MAG: type I-E CRISPR-associated protein Cas5/CasD, partial [Athalassotoga sp.]|uniref:type I-E CRISPR-associated protein Cas5/CasD n=1 Tax=Athalassotoga sp. TaxID=2022597 RepID=UPI003CFE6186
FFVRSEFGIFPDPTITTNKVTYFLPNKSNIIGLLGAIIGIPRKDEIDGLYSKEYLRFLKATKIGIKLVNRPRKIIFFTNHISLKESKTKPFKTEMLVRPEYKIYFTTDKNYEEEIVKKIPDNDKQIPKEGYVYTPYLGEAFCLANLYNLKEETELEKLGANERDLITMDSVFI